jgi:hypothetical protein
MFEENRNASMLAHQILQLCNERKAILVTLFAVSNHGLHRLLREAQDWQEQHSQVRVSGLWPG